MNKRRNIKQSLDKINDPGASRYLKEADAFKILTSMFC